MAIVLEDPRNIGGNIGTSLNRALGSLAQNKLDKIHRNMMIKEDANQIQNLLGGISPRQAHALAYAKQTDPKVFQDIVKAYFIGGGFEGKEENENDLDSILKQLQGSDQPQQEQQNQSPLQSLNAPQRNNPLGFGNQLNQGTLQGIFGNDKDLGNLLSSISGNQPSNVQAQQETLNAQNQQIQQQPQSNTQIQQPNKPVSFNQKIQKGLQNPDLDIKKETLELKKQGLKQKESIAERKIEHEDQKIADKETLPLYNEIVTKHEANKENNRRLARQKELIKKGNLNDSTFASALDTLAHGIFGLGIDLGGLKTADSQEFEKISTDFLKDAKAIFGNRITDTDLRAFLRTVPTLLQSDEGKLRVIHNLELANKASELKYNALKDILKENKGKRPRDLAIQINERVSDQLDKLSEEFTKGLPEAKEEKRTSTASSIASGLVNLLVKLPHKIGNEIVNELARGLS